MNYPPMTIRFSVAPQVAPATLEDIAEANEILSGVFSFYGEKYQLPADIDWTFNPGTGHWGHDLNRFLFLEPLTRAYLHTSEERYARKCLHLIFSWIEQSKSFGAREPVAVPYMWNSYLNIAIHLMRWAWCLAALNEQAPEMLSAAEYAAIVASVEAQLDWLDEVIPTHRNNWVQIGCRGVLVTLAYLPQLQRATEWSERAWLRMSDAIGAQLLPDGVQDELAVHYHFTVAVCALDALEMADKTPTRPSEKLFDQVASMLHYLRQTLSPDGAYVVSLNDSDPEYGEITRRFLARPLAQRMLEKIRRPLESECFPYAGTVILREGEAQGRDELYAAFDAGPYGMAHQHEDKLGLWLAAFGRSFLVDPGRHLYDRSDISFWPFLCSTAAHSTIMVDGEGQYSRSARDVPGAWRADTPLPILFEKAADGSCVTGAFYDLGYGKQRIQAVHFRLLFFFPDINAWAIADSVDGAGPHVIESRFQFAPGDLVRDGLAVQTDFADANLRIQGRAEDWETLRIAKGALAPREGWFSKGVNKIEPAPCAVFATGAWALPHHSLLALTAFRGREANPELTARVFDRVSAQRSPLLEKLRSLRQTGSL